MKNLQTKGYINIILIVLGFVLVGALGYVALVKKLNTIEKNSAIVISNSVTTQVDVEKLIREYFANNYKNITSADLSQQRFRNVSNKYYYGAHIYAVYGDGGKGGLVYVIVENNKIIKLITNVTSLEGIFGKELVAAGFPVDFDSITEMCRNGGC